MHWQYITLALQMRSGFSSIAHEHAQASFLSPGYYVSPDQTYTTDMLLNVGGLAFHLHHQQTVPGGTGIYLPAYRLLFLPHLLVESRR